MDTTQTNGTSDKRSLISKYGQSNLSDAFPPRVPFVGRVTDWDVSESTFPDRANPAKMIARKSLVLKVENLERAEETSDGKTVVWFYPLSDRKTSYYGLCMAAWAGSMRDITGNAAFTLDTPDDFDKLVGVTATFKEISGDKDPLFGNMRGDFKSSKNYGIMVGTPDASYTSRIPADLAQQQDAAAKRYADKQALKNGAGNSNGSIPGGMTGAVIGSHDSAPPTINPATESILVEFFAGKTDAEIAATVATPAGLRGKVDEQTLLNVFGGQAQSALIGSGKLSVGADGRYASQPVAVA